MVTLGPFVIASACLVFCVLAIPVQEKPLDILTLMSQDSNVCKFPPADVLRTPTKAPYIYLPCQKSMPDIEEYEEGLAGLRTYLDASGDKIPFLCMGFYDLSLQICKSSINTASLVNNTEQFNNLFNDETRSVEFCRDIKPYVHSISESEFTKDWVQILNENLEDEGACKSLCTHTMRNKVSVHPICKILLWGRKRLQQTTSETPVLDEVVQGEGAGAEEGIASQQDMYTDTYATDLEAKDTSQSHQESLRPSEELSPVNERPVPIRGPSTPLTHMEMKVEPAVKQDVVTVSHEEAVVKTTEEKNVTEISPKAEVVPSSEPKPSESSPSSTSSSTPSSSSISPSPVSSSTSVSSVLPDNFNLPEANSNRGSTSNIEQPTEDYDSADAITNNSIDNPSEDNFRGDDDDEDEDVPEPREKSRVSSVVPSRHNYLGDGEFTDAEDSHFFAYFLAMVAVFIVGYLVFHNKQKILALVLEGRRNGRGSRRRPSTSSYRKLDSNLEEAISSSTPRTNPHVIY